MLEKRVPFPVEHSQNYVGQKESLNLGWIHVHWLQTAESAQDCTGIAAAVSGASSSSHKAESQYQPEREGSPVGDLPPWLARSLWLL